MARGKKAAKELSPEEKLQQALVPAEEWPYPIPENWCWTTVDKVATVITGGTPSKKNPEYYGDQFPFFKPTELRLLSIFLNQERMLQELFHKNQQRYAV